MSGSRSSRRNISGGRGRSSNPNTNNLPKVGKDRMASWQDIQEKEDVESVFGSFDLSQISLEDKMDLMMVSMAKLQKSVARKDEVIEDLATSINDCEYNMNEKLPLTVKGLPICSSLCML